jgi:hypothetical protein
MTTRTVRKYRVYTKELWFNDWTEQTSLFVDTCAFETAPNISQASMHYNFGRVMREGTVTHDVSAPLEIVGHFVKIEIDQGDAPAKKWIGTITDETQDRHANMSDRRLKTGIQYLRALGFEYLLSRQFVYQSKTSFYPDYIKRGIPFNRGGASQFDGLGSPQDGTGNKRPTDNEFEGNYAQIGADKWTAGEIVDYLLANFAPKSADDLVAVRFILSDEGFALLDALTPSLPTDGRSVKELLDQLIDRRRLMSWYLDFDDADQCIVNVFTLNPALFTLPDGTVIPRNDNTKTYHFDDAPGSLVRVLLTRDATQKYDRVIARGEPVIYCATFGTVNYAQGPPSGVPTLYGEYDAGDVSAYNNAGVGDAEYAVLDNDFDRLRHIEEARAKPENHRTFRRFRAVTLDWDEIPEYFPSFADTTESTRVFAPGLRFLPFVPLRAGLDYSGSLPPADDTSIEYQRPLVIGTIDGSSPQRYALLDSYSRSAFDDETLRFAGMEWAVECRPLESAFGVDLTVIGAPQHTLGLGLYNPAEPLESFAGTPAIFRTGSYETGVTLAFAADEHATAQWPTTPLPAPIDYVRELTITVPGAGATYIAPNTVYSLDTPSNPLRTTSGLWVRDDTKILEAVARSAYEWYRQARVAIDVVDENLICPYERGQLITGIGSPGIDEETANTCVTRVSFDFRAGTSNVVTQFAELLLGG